MFQSDRKHWTNSLIYYRGSRQNVNMFSSHHSFDYGNELLHEPAQIFFKDYSFSKTQQPGSLQGGGSTTKSHQSLSRPCVARNVSMPILASCTMCSRFCTRRHRSTLKNSFLYTNQYEHLYLKMSLLNDAMCEN